MSEKKDEVTSVKKEEKKGKSSAKKPANKTSKAKTTTKKTAASTAKKASASSTNTKSTADTQKKTSASTTKKKTTAKGSAAKKETTSAKKKTATTKKAAAKKEAPKKTAASKTSTKKAEVKKDKKKILFVASESQPFAGTGGLGEVISSLSRTINTTSEEYDVRVVLPLYLDIPFEYREKLEYLGNTYVPLAWRSQYCGVFKLVHNNTTFYFIDNEYYFKREGLYGFFDDAERYAFFCKAVIESFWLMDFIPDIIHCHDWQSALIPIYLKYKYYYPNIKTMYTIHNIEYQGQYDLSIMGDVLDLPPEAGSDLEYYGDINLMKGAIETASIVSTVSPSYANELKYQYFAHGLQDIIIKNEGKMVGILNGIDTVSYDPKTDNSVFVKYDAKTFEKKKENKKALQEFVNLPVDENIPLIAIISRLVEHKGIDLVSQIIEEVIQGPVQLVILGTGDRRFEDHFRWLQSQFNGKVSTLITFNGDIARKIYSGADILLMPSKSEPCGLAQMIASRYGTVPIVSNVGGLKDSITDCSFGEGNGFVFENYTAHEFLETIYRAINVYNNKEDWNNLVKWIMQIDFGWKKSAKEYENIYKQLLS